MAETKEFDWKGEAGDKFAEINPSSAEGHAQEMEKYFNTSGFDIFSTALGFLKENGFNLEEAKIIDVGCSSGGKMAIMEKMGAKASNLYGIDPSPKAIAVNKENHPDYHLKEIDGFNYNVIQDVDTFDLVYHSGVFCQVPEEDYGKFFDGIKALKPKFYMFLEGISTTGPHKIPNSLAHAHHEHKHGHHHKHGYHHHGHESAKDSKKEAFDVMDEGFHHVDELEKVAAKFLPEANQIGRLEIAFKEDIKEMFNVLKMDHFLLSVYKLE